MLLHHWLGQIMTPLPAPIDSHLVHCTGVCSWHMMGTGMCRQTETLNALCVVSAVTCMLYTVEGIAESIHNLMLSQQGDVAPSPALEPCMRRAYSMYRSRSCAGTAARPRHALRQHAQTFRSAGSWQPAPPKDFGMHCSLTPLTLRDWASCAAGHHRVPRRVLWPVRHGQGRAVRE